MRREWGGGRPGGPLLAPRGNDHPPGCHHSPVHDSSHHGHRLWGDLHLGGGGGQDRPGRWRWGRGRGQWVSGASGQKGQQGAEGLAQLGQSLAEGAGQLPDGVGSLLLGPQEVQGGVWGRGWRQWRGGRTGGRGCHLDLLRWLGGWWQRRGWGGWRQGQAGQLDGLQGRRGRGLTLLGCLAAPFLRIAGGSGPRLRAARAPLAVGWCICGERDVGKMWGTPNAVTISLSHLPRTLDPEASFSNLSQVMPWSRSPMTQGRETIYLTIIWWPIPALMEQGPGGPLPSQAALISFSVKANMLEGSEPSRPAPRPTSGSTAGSWGGPRGGGPGKEVGWLE